MRAARPRGQEGHVEPDDDEGDPGQGEHPRGSHGRPQVLQGCHHGLQDDRVLPQLEEGDGGEVDDGPDAGKHRARGGVRGGEEGGDDAERQVVWVAGVVSEEFKC